MRSDVSIRNVPTSEFASLVYGRAGTRGDDPAEAFHEASRLYPNIAPGRLATIADLAGSSELRQTVARSSRTHAHRPGIDLPDRCLRRARFGRLLQARRSAAAGARRTLPLSGLAALLAAGYRCEPRPDGSLRRPVPSGGALYPLELYAVATAVDGLASEIYHYDPFRHRLESLAEADPERVRAVFVEPEVADGAAALVVITALFWRSRFKYGARGYRFALLEAGHVAQNIVLAASALALPVLPVGGFYDRRLDALVGVAGLDEAALYAIVVGGR